MADEHAYDFSGTINVPFWHQNLVLAILSSLGILGIFLNGFVICCFILHPMVSKDLFRNTDLLSICILLISEKHWISSIYQICLSRQYFTKCFLQIRTPYNYLLINLAIAELVLASAGVAFDILPLIHHGWPFGVNVCIGTGALITTSGMHF